MSEWEKPFAEGIVDLDIDGEIIKYDPLSGKLYNIESYSYGRSSNKVQIHSTGRGVIKFKVDGKSHRAMDVIHRQCFNVVIPNARAYPANGDFRDLRLENIVMIRINAPKLEDDE